MTGSRGDAKHDGMKRHTVASVVGLFTAFGLAACGQGGAPSGPVSEATAEASAAADAAAASYSYEVRLVLSPETAQLLSRLDEQVTISSDYYGVARKGGAAAKAHDALGAVILGQETLDVAPSDQTVRIVSPAIAPASLKDVEGEAQLLVNVYTARKGAEDNLIECGVYDGSLAVATVRPILIECGLSPVATETGLADQ